MHSLIALFLVSTSVAIIQCQPFTVSISTAGHYAFGDAVTCKVTVVNSQNDDYYLLKRGTPLEPINNIFSVTRGNKNVKYDGLLYQRVMPTQEEYVLLPAKSSITATVDLSRSYQFNAREGYNVKLDTKLTYYKTAYTNTSYQHISSNSEHFTMVGNEGSHRPTEAEELRRNSSSIKRLDLAIAQSGAYVKTPIMAGSPYGSDIQSTVNVYMGGVYNVLPISYNAVDSNPKAYTTWFGNRYQGYMDSVKGVYFNIKSAMELYQFTMFFDGPQCTKIENIIAYTYKGSTTIYLCPLYRQESDTKGPYSKLGTILHELTHAVAYTDDLEYGPAQCAALAAREPYRAIQNADNYRLFSEPLVK
jgi:hypothetical protein